MDALGLQQVDVKSAYWKKFVEFAHKEQKNKVYQRDDLIDLKKVDARGRSNAQRMKNGLAPLGPDNQPINLHHMLQTPGGPISEVLQSFHKKFHQQIHINTNDIPTGINRQNFDQWRQAYWKNRGANFNGE